MGLDLRPLRCFLFALPMIGLNGCACCVVPDVASDARLAPISCEDDRVFLAQDIEGQALLEIGLAAKTIISSDSSEVEVRGHTNGRGTKEYDSALEARRASSARDVLVHHGVDPARIRTVSFGQEAPLVPHHKPDAEEVNSRVEILFGACIPDSGSADDQGPPVSRYRIDSHLRILLDSLRSAAHREDIVPFKEVVGAKFTAHRDFGGVTSKSDQGMANFKRVFGLDHETSSNTNDHRGWQALEYYLASEHLQKTSSGYCAPWFAAEVPFTERSQLCFAIDAQGQWQIDHVIMAGD